ncbi:hypothetical protein KUTeg_005494 [Tegillarca granosa]|uniref:Uncharacterized protein n=1 Tax=Tegillarca granosa TaxID=220873 RepID=A0ABQ9FMV9_TEGGR|nr:hypothetical protein KUTeg_005494 [Tegillarca granosa]
MDMKFNNNSSIKTHGWYNMLRVTLVNYIMPDGIILNYKQVTLINESQQNVVDNMERSYRKYWLPFYLCHIIVTSKFHNQSFMSEIQEKRTTSSGMQVPKKFSGGIIASWSPKASNLPSFSEAQQAEFQKNFHRSIASSFQGSVRITEILQQDLAKKKVKISKTLQNNLKYKVFPHKYDFFDMSSCRHLLGCRLKDVFLKWFNWGTVNEHIFNERTILNKNKNYNFLISYFEIYKYFKEGIKLITVIFQF